MGRVGAHTGGTPLITPDHWFKQGVTPACTRTRGHRHGCALDCPGTHILAGTCILFIMDTVRYKCGGIFLLLFYCFFVLLCTRTFPNTSTSTEFRKPPCTWYQQGVEVPGVACTVPKRKTSCFGWRADIPIKQDDAADITQSIYSEMPYQASKSIFRQYGRNLGGRGAFR